MFPRPSIASSSISNWSSGVFLESSVRGVGGEFDSSLTFNRRSYRTLSTCFKSCRLPFWSCVTTNIWSRSTTSWLRVEGKIEPIGSDNRIQARANLISSTRRDGILAPAAMSRMNHKTTSTHVLAKNHKWWKRLTWYNEWFKANYGNEIESWFNELILAQKNPSPLMQNSHRRGKVYERPATNTYGRTYRLNFEHRLLPYLIGNWRRRPIKNHDLQCR